ncbi:MAG: transposase [Gammaproteobacteria bacterium]|nr:transposase [Gammaproteobacteria bacterium]
MPRPPRYFIPGIPQHVIQRGVDRQPTFFETADYELYLQVLRAASQQHDCPVHAYVLMTNHTHLLVSPGNERSIALLMQAIGRHYVQPINKRYNRTGTLWQARYKASLVQTDRYLLTCHRYIELNPVRAGMVRHPAEYRWSSYQCNANGKGDPIVVPHSLYQCLGQADEERRHAYRGLFADSLSPDELDQIRTVTNSCRVLGNDRFRDQVEAMLGRSVRPGKAGRPRKRPVGDCYK